jgi:hypothetical protein
MSGKQAIASRVGGAAQHRQWTHCGVPFAISNLTI